MLALWRLVRLGVTAVLITLLVIFFEKQNYVIKAVKVVLEQFKLAK